MKPRILFISSRPLFPIVGGDQIRTVQQLNFLMTRYEVDIVYISQVKNDIIPLEYKTNLGRIFRFEIGKIQSILQTLRFLFNRLPLQVNYYYSSSIAKAINSISSQYHFVFCNNIRTAEYVRKNKEVLKYIDFVDAISMNYDKARHEAKGIKRIIYEMDYRRCLNYEQKCIRDFDGCAIISDIDNKYISKWQR